MGREEKEEGRNLRGKEKEELVLGGMVGGVNER